MAAGVTASIAVEIKSAQVGATTGFGTPRAPANLSFLQQFIAGTLADNQANLQYDAEIILTTGQTANLDLAGVLTTGLGATITAAEVMLIALVADSANTTNIAFFGAASNAFNGPLSGTTPVLTLKPGAAAFLVDPDGWGVTAGTADILQVTNGSGASATYKVIIIARTAAA